VPLRERPVPTHVGAEETILEFGALALRASQGMHLVAGGLLALEAWNDLEGAPLWLRQGLAGLCLLAGVVGAIWRIDGKPLWAWLLIGLSHVRFPHAAIWRVEPRVVEASPDAAWVEVSPPLVWPPPEEQR
jgi:hypothetical protein